MITCYRVAVLHVVVCMRTVGADGFGIRRACAADRGSQYALSHLTWSILTVNEKFQVAAVRADSGRQHNGH